MTIKFKTNLRVGSRTIEIEETVETPNQMFERLAYWDSWAIKPPANDVYFRFRVTKEKGFKYYSMVCPSADKEFHFGQLMDGKNTLFPKHKEGWVPRYHAGADEEPEEAHTPAPQASEKTKMAEQDQLWLRLTQSAWGTLVHPQTREAAGDFVFALLSAPKESATVEQLRRGIAAIEKACKQPVILEWAATAWLYERESKSSLATKMEILGLMCRYLHEVGDFQDLLTVLGGDLSKRNRDTVLRVRDNLKSWFTVDTGVLTEADIKF